ncbi:MAG TPA: ATP-binding protein [Longimicrobiales bacterium]|nr:ATP-binding protein [Longimicrobiales bacterium]
MSPHRRLRRLIGLGPTGPGLRARITGWLVALAVVGILGGTFGVFVTARQLLTEQIHDRLEATLANRSLEVDRWVDDVLGDIAYAAQGSGLVGKVLWVRERPDSAELRAEVRALLRDINIDGHYRRIFVELAPELFVPVSTDSTREGVFRSEPTVPPDFGPGTWIQEVYASPEDGRPIIAVAAPVESASGRLLAYLVAEVDFASLSDILDQPLGFGGAAETYAVSSVGDRITPEAVGDEGHPRGIDSEGIARALAGESGVATYTNYRGDRVLGAFTWREDRRMALLIELPEEVALAPARRLAGVAFFGGVILLLVLAIIGRSLAGQILAPVERMAEAAKRVAGGDLSARVEPSGQDELFVLATAFNRMVDRVERAYVELKDQADAASWALKQVEGSRALLESLTENSPGIIVVVGPDGRITLSNRRFSDVFGIRGSPVGRPLDTVVPAPVLAALQEARRRALSRGDGVEVEFDLQAHELLHFTGVLFPLSTEAPSRVSVGFVALDRTAARQAAEEHQRLETQLRATQKLESLGVLAGGVAHDFNNLLQAVAGHASLLDAELLPEEAREPLRQIRTAAARASDLTGQLLAYAGRRALRLEEVGVNELLVDLGELVRVSLPRTARLDIELGDDVGAVRADPAQISQVILNLLTNAGESLPDGRGRVSARTSRLRLEADRSSDVPSREILPDGDYIRLEVQDNGKGMSAETLDRIFDPFFTTKDSGRGLGLAAVTGIVHGSGGHVEVRSAQGEGTTFLVYLPRLDGTAELAAAPEEPEPGVGIEGRTLLVADDESAVLSFLERALEHAGATVFAAADGDQAVELVREHLHDIDGLILDLTMPGRGGVEVLQEAWALRPDLPALLSSGFDLMDSLGELAEDERVALLHKPYRMENLVKAVETLFQRGSAPEAAQTR